MQKTIEKLNLGDHACLIYENQDEWREIVIPFMTLGLSRNEKCIYVVNNNTKARIRILLYEQGINVKAYENAGQLAILKESEVYTRKNIFNPDHMISLLVSETRKALSQGYVGLRVSGEMTWALKGYPGSERLNEYEMKLNESFFNKFPCVAVCQYDRHKFNANTIRNVILSHQIIIYRKGVYKNYFYIPPDRQSSDTYTEKQIDHWLTNLKEPERAVK